MAGNYLQALNWQRDAKILKSIVTFYSKGQAFDLLANFYATNAQLEVDENKDYPKALAALQEASKCLARIPNTERAAEQLQRSIVEVKKIMQFREALQRGGAEIQPVIAGCKNILASPGGERAPVRYSDVMILLFEACMVEEQFQEALALLRDLTRRVPDWSVRGLIERKMIERLAEESDLSFESIWSAGDGRYKGHAGVGQVQQGGSRDAEEEEEIEEEVEWKN